MKEQTQALLDKAVRNLAASHDLTRQGHFEIAVSRAYYAMFYAAEAALLEEGLEFSSHGASAHCHLGLGAIYGKMGRSERARAELSTAIDMYRSMEMAFWLPQAEAELGQAG